jgi:hypothetical protein
LISNKNIGHLAESLSLTENQAASNYVQFQKHFLKVNSLLNRGLDGIISLKEGVPGFFELERNDKAHFMIKSEAE